MLNGSTNITETHIKNITDDLSFLSKQITEAKQSVDRDKGGLQQLAVQTEQRFGITLEELDIAIENKQKLQKDLEARIVASYNKLKESYQW